MAGQKHADKSDVLTPWKDQDRRGREVYVPSGVPDPATRQGVFNRAWNPGRPDLNSRDGMARSASGPNPAFAALADWYAEHAPETE